MSTPPRYSTDELLHHRRDVDCEPSRAVVGLGHDLQLIEELRDRPALREPGVLFTEAELTWMRNADEPTHALATAFSVKEAFFKAMPVQSGWDWTEVELKRTDCGRPTLSFHGALAALMSAQGWRADVSLSHSGQYVSSVVLIQRA